MTSVCMHEPAMDRRFPINQWNHSSPPSHSLLIITAIGLNMSKLALADPSSADEKHTDENGFSRWETLSRRERLRVHIGGLLFIGLGCYIIWRTIVVLLGLFPATTTEHLWQNTRYVFVLYTH